MAFPFDSLDFLAPPLLFGACLAAWTLAGQARAAVRINLRFGAVLFAALPAACVVALTSPAERDLALAVALIVVALGTAALAMGLFALSARAVPPLAATLLLGLALAGGLAAAMTGAPVLALGAQIPGAGLMIAAALGGLADAPRLSWLSLLAALALLCGGLTLMGVALDCTLVFCAAGLIGAAGAVHHTLRSSSSGSISGART